MKKKTEFPGTNWMYLIKKLAHPYEYFNCLNDYQKPVNDLEKEGLISKLKNKCPSNNEIERTKEII